MKVEFTPAAPGGHRTLVGLFLKAHANPKTSASNRRALEAKIAEAVAVGRSKGWNR